MVALAVAGVVAGWAGATVVPTSHSAFSSFTVSPANTFGAATFCPNVAPAWMTGMEHGVTSSAGDGIFSALSAAGGSISASSEVPRSGNYSLRLNDTSNAGDTWIDSSIINSTTMIVRFAMRLTSLPSSGMGQIASVWTSSGTQIASVGYDNSTQKLHAQFDGGTVRAAASTISAGQWYRVDLRINTGGATHTLDWRINGVAQTQATRSSSAMTMEDLTLGSVRDADIYNAYIDDIVITTDSSDYPLADGRILGLVPNAMGTITNPNGYLKDNSSTTNISSTSWTLLDGLPMTSTAGYIRQTTASSGSHAHVAFADIARTKCIDAVRAVVALHSSGTTANQAKTSIFEGSTETVVHNDSVATTSLTYRGKVITPATGSWTTSKLNSLQARIGSAVNTASEPYWDGLLLEYEQSTKDDTIYENVVLADNPAGYWRLAETSGTTVTARSGSPNGTYLNLPVRGVSSMVGDTNTGVIFNGVDDAADFGNVHGFTGTASFTIEAWLNPTAPTASSTARRIIAKEGTAGWDLDISGTGDSPSNRVAIARWDSGGGVDFTRTTTGLQPDTWYHVVATYDGATLRMYLNGVLESSAPSTRSVGAHTNPLRFGGGSNSANYFGGEIDEVAIYTTALSATRIQEHYNTGRR
jgi:hypothetical protein